LLVRFRRSATPDAEENVPTGPELTLFAAVGPVGRRAVGVCFGREWPM
jgi:hypothetical protein